MKFIARLMILSLVGVLAIACEKKNAPENDPTTKMNNAKEANVKMNDILAQLTGQGIYLISPKRSEKAIGEMNVDKLQKTLDLVSQYLKSADVVMITYREDEVEAHNRLQLMIDGATRVQAMVSARLGVALPKPPTTPLPDDKGPSPPVADDSDPITRAGPSPP